MRRRVELHILGRVQGVWFRASAEREARALGLQGAVWNEPDGSVGLWAEGPEDAVEALVRWCHRGPPRADVREVQRTDREPLGADGEFVVLRDRG